MHKFVNATVLSTLPSFEACARNLSFSRAARELHVTSGAVSQQIRQLEERLGCRLFNRLGRSVTLTPAGEMLLETVGATFARLSLVLSAINQPAGPIHISCSPSFAMLWLMPRLRNFHLAHPGVDIRLVAEFQCIDRSSLSAGRIDAAIRYDATDYKGMDVLPLMNEYLFPVASPSYLAQHKANIMRPGFPDLSLLQDSSAWDEARPDIEWRTWLDAYAPSTAAVYSAQEFNLFMMALTAARSHQGICIGRAALVREELLSGSLVDFTGAQVQSPASYKLITSRPDDPRVHAFRVWLKQEADVFIASSLDQESN